MAKAFVAKQFQVTLTQTIRIPVSMDIAKSMIEAVAHAENAHPGHKAQSVEIEGRFQDVVGRCSACNVPVLEDENYTFDSDKKIIHGGCLPKVSP